ncbi:MAG: hypothetical protein ACE5E6_10760, partial [Phycisphaerae bacterium]
VIPGFPVGTTTLQIDGSQAGTVSGDGSTITWTSVTGTATTTDSLGTDPVVQDLNDVFVLGTWTLQP